MKRHWAAACVAATLAFANGGAFASHFDGDPSTGTFNPQLATSISNNVVDRASTVHFDLTQADHEDPPVVSYFRSPADWQFAFASTRPAEKPDGTPATRCEDALDNHGNSPNGTGSGGQLDFSKRTDATVARAEKIGSGVLKIAATGVTRPGNPATWNGHLLFISYVPPTAKLCLFLITNDARVTSLPDTDPTSGGDDIEEVTELVVEFDMTQTASAWEIKSDLTGTVQNPVFQAPSPDNPAGVDVSVIQLIADVFGTSVGNWNTGGALAFSRAPHVSGNKTFSGQFTTCPPSDATPNHDWGACLSDKPQVNRSATFAVILPAPAITAPIPGAIDNDGTITIGGTADPLAQVQVYEGASPYGAPTVADGAGAWSVDRTFSEGVHSVFARTIDAGGSSANSNTRSFTIDTPPPPPSVTSPGPGETVGAGAISVSGAAQPGSTVKVYEGGPALSTTTANGTTGAWSTTVNIASKGSHTLTATATDTGGEGFPTPFAFTVTTAVPIIDAPAEGDAFPVQAITLSGTAEAGSILKVFEGGVEIESTTTDGTGHWSVGHSFSEAVHAITATATGALDALVSPPTPVRNFTIDLTAPDAPGITSPAAGADVGSATLAIAGTSEANATIILRENGSPFAQGIANGSGNWTIPAVLSIGEHTVTAVAKDKAGNPSLDSDPRTFNVVQSIIIDTPDENTFQPRAVKLSGRADPVSSQVILYEGATQRGTATVTGGAWSVTLTLPEGTHTFTAKSVTAGVLSPASAPRTFKVDGTTPILTAQQPSNGGLAIMMPGDAFRGSATDLGGSGVKSIAISYFSAGGTFVSGQAAVCHGCTGQSVTWDAVPVLQPGVYTAQIRAIDAVNNGSSATQFTIVVL